MLLFATRCAQICGMQINPGENCWRSKLQRWQNWQDRISKGEGGNSGVGFECPMDSGNEIENGCGGRGLVPDDMVSGDSLFCLCS